MNLSNKKTRLIVLISLFFVFAGFAIAAYAANATSTFKYQAQWPVSPMGTDIAKDTNPTVAKAIKYLYEWGVGLGGLAVFIALIWAGFEYITSIGNPTKMQGAFDRIRDAIIGLIILLSSYAVLSLIGINLTSLKISPFQANFTSQASTCKELHTDVADDCCNMIDSQGNPPTKIKGCNPAYYECVGWVSGGKDGYCMPRTTKADCKSAKIYYEANGVSPDPIDNLDNRFDTSKKGNIKWVIFYGVDEKGNPFKDASGNPLPCYDPTAIYEATGEIIKTEAGIALNNTDNPVCNCGLQLYTKAGTSTGGLWTGVCENADISVVANYSAFKTYTSAKNVVCVMLIKG